MLSRYFKPAINYSSWTDRFSSLWTFLLLLIMSVVVALRHYIGPNVTCFPPFEARFTPQIIDYVNDRCWSARQINVYYPNNPLYQYAIVSDGGYSRRKESTRTLYQWLPLIIACQALFFRLPDILLRVCDSLFGYGSSKIVGLVRGYKDRSSIDKMAMAREIANYFNEIFAIRPLKFIGITTLVIVVVKLLFLINALTQLIILDGYMSYTNATSYGEHIIESINSRNYSNIVPSPSFPRSFYCYVDLHRYIPRLNHTNYTQQCLVPVNELNEQVCFFIWMWLLIVCVAAIISLLVFVIKTFIPMFNRRYIEKYLKMANLVPTKTQLATFTSSVIGHDGVLLLKMIGEVSSDILVRDIVVKIWYMHYMQEPNSRSQGVQYPEKIGAHKS